MSQLYLEITPMAGLNYRLDTCTVFQHSRGQAQIAKFIREGCMHLGEWVVTPVLFPGPFLIPLTLRHARAGLLHPVQLRDVSCCGQGTLSEAGVLTTSGL